MLYYTKKECNNYNLERIEVNICTLLHDLKLEKKWSGDGISKLDELDIEYFIGFINAIIEKNKAIQMTILFTGLLMTTLFNFFSLGSLEIIFVVLGLGVTIEYCYKNEIANYTFLKELLLIYKSHKFKKV